jgi:hypothetical protein
MKFAPHGTDTSAVDVIRPFWCFVVGMSHGNLARSDRTRLRRQPAGIGPIRHIPGAIKKQAQSVVGGRDSALERVEPGAEQARVIR